jgi:antitoxin FitA
MPDFLLRNLDQELLEALHARASANGRSLQAEIHAILRDTLFPKPSADEAWARLLRHRKELEGREFPDVVEMLREDRESH